MIEASAAEINQQPDFMSGSRQVIDNLRVFRATHPRQCFQFNNYGVKTNKIGRVFGRQELTFLKSGVALIHERMECCVG